MGKKAPKIALVTGAARRVGAHLAKRLAQEGYHLYLHYHRSHQEALQVAQSCRAFGVTVETFSGDFSTPKGVEALLFALQGKPTPSLVIHNASLFPRATFDEISWDAMEVLFRVNCFSPFFLTQGLKKAMEKQKGHVICILDEWAFSPRAAYMAYQLSKQALATFVYEASQVLAPSIRVNGIAPTVMLYAEHETMDQRKKIRQRLLLGESSPEELTQAVLFLENTPSITGTILRWGGLKR